MAEELPASETTIPRAGNRRVGYAELLRSNRNFRTLWYGQIVSELGDWFSTVALLNLMLDLTGRAQVVGWFFIIIFLPVIGIAPVAGVLADRFDRKKLMIAMDLVRAILVLGYLFVIRADQIWAIYLIATFEVAMATVFEPARSAIIPDICRTEELLPANALGSITWSLLLAAGAAVGGFVTASFGRNTCYILDSISFIGSAVFISRLNPQRGRTQRLSHQEKSLSAGFREMFNGFGYLRRCPRVLALSLVKTGWALGAGVLLLISIFGQQIFPLLGSGAAGIGALYAARGIGAALGPILARRVIPERSQAMRHAITAGFLMSCVGYIFFGQSKTFWAAAAGLVLGHAGSSVNWVYSTVLLQMEVPNEFRGRVFATELAFMTLGIALSNYVAGYCLDVLRLGPRTVATLIGAYFSIPAILWLIGSRKYKSGLKPTG